MKKIKFLFLAVLIATFAIGQTAIKTYTANYTVTSGDDGAAIIMQSASALVVTLPTPSATGFTVTIHKRGAGSITITPPGTHTISTGTAGASLTNTTSGVSDWVALVYTSTGVWTVSASVGTWGTNVSTNPGIGLHLPLSVLNGGTGKTTVSGSFDAISPMTTLGDIIYGGLAGTGTRLSFGATGKAFIAGATIPGWDDILSSVPTGLTYTTATRALSLTTGYVIPGGGTQYQVLMSQGASAPAFSTPTFSVTATAGNALIGDGTNWTSATILSSVPTGLTYTSSTRALSFSSGYSIPTDAAIAALAPKASPSFTSSVTDLASSEADFDVDEVKSTGITGFGMVQVAETSGKLMGIFRLDGNAIVSVSANAAFSVSKDTGSKINVYWETDQVKIQNKIATGVIEAVSVVAAGADYLVNDVLTLDDGAAGTVTVTTISGDAHVDAITLTATGLGYTTGVKATTAAPAGGTGCTVDVTAVDGGDGHVDTVSLTATGLGYAINDVLTLAGGTGGDATVTVTAIDKGHVTGVTLTAPGTGYSVATHTTAAGTGTGCTIGVTAIVGLVLKVAYFGIVI